MQLNLRYSVPITEGLEGNDFIIQGTAINETTTSNNHKFLSEELIPAASTLTGCPLLVDHENKVENIKGRVLLGMYNEMGKRVDFKAKVMDETCKQMIKDGRLNSVSVGAMVKDVEEKDGELIPRGITFKELSLVAVPADSGATFNIAMKEAYSASKQLETSSTDKALIVNSPQVEPVATVESEVIEDKEKICPDCKKPMNKCECEDEDEEEKCKTKEESQQINPLNAESHGADNLTELKGGLEQMSESIEQSAKVDETAALKEQIALLVKEVASMKESSKKVEEKVVLKNEFEESDAEVQDKFKIVQGNGYFSYVANAY